MQLLLDSSIVAVNCVHVGDGARAGPEQRENKDGFIIDVSLWRHVGALFCHAAVSCQLTGLSYFPH